MGFYQACVEARGPPELEEITIYYHLAVSILRHMRAHHVPITMPYVMRNEELENATYYGSHNSANKEQACVRGENYEQLQ